MHTPDGILMYPVAHIRSDFPTKFGIPKQSGLSQALEARVVFCPEYRSADAVRGLEEFSHIWLLWQFSAAVREGETFSPTVRPPRLGGNKRIGVFASLIVLIIGMIIGSISGVRPTATEIANRKASSQSPFVRPLMKNTTGTMTSMKRINIQETALTPLVKFVSTASPATETAMDPNKVSSPTEITTAVALPLITLLPIKAMFV